VEFFVLGTAGHAQEVADALTVSVAAGNDASVVALRCAGRVGPLAQFLDGPLGGPWLGEDAVLEGLSRDARFALGVGDPVLRRTLWDRAQALGFSPIPARRHPASAVASDLEAGAGTIILALAGVANAAALDEGVLVQQGAVVGHEATVGRFSVVNPNAAVSGCVRIGEGVMIGAQAVILEGLTIGDGARVGAGAVVTRDVPPGATVVGNPAHVVG
jgi:UDP-perosamine 4-acetyltransferase